MNNKGLTIIELIISITLISIIVLFMYRLLSNITFEKDNDFIATLNSQQRLEILDIVHWTINEDSSVLNTKLSSNKKVLSFTNASGATTYYTLNRESNTKLTFSKGSTVINTWTIKGGTLANSFECKDNVTHDVYTMVSCRLPIYTTNIDNNINTSSSTTVNNNNVLDDLEFSFVFKR